MSEEELQSECGAHKAHDNAHALCLSRLPDFDGMFGHIRVPPFYWARGS